MSRRILTARENYELLSPWLHEAGTLQDYRDERHRQELELEKATGGYSADKADYFARGGKPLINYKDFLRSQKVGDGEQAAREGPVSHETYTPDPVAWGTDDDLPAWVTARRWITAADDRHPDLLESERLHGTAHTTGGRFLPGHRLAASPEEQEARLADPAGWQNHVAIPPSQKAIGGARQYAAARGLPDPHQVGYENVMQDPDTVRRVGRAYDALPAHDPNAEKHYAAMGREVNDQYHHMTHNMGINVQTVDHDPYPDVHHMMHDVDNNNRLQVLGTHVTGAHPFFDDETNDKFRAVHDYFGHAATGRSFDRHGEQAAYLAHSQMFSPQARPALHAETQGQNSSLILNGQFGPQKVATLPPEMHGDKSLGAYSPGKVAAHDFDRGLTQHLDEHGGATFKEHPGDGPTSGYMVSQTPDNKLPTETYHPSQVRDLRDQNRDKLGPDDYNGVWQEPDAVYHEIAKNHPEYGKAQQDAYDRDQIAFYDLNHGAEIDTAQTQYNGTPGIWMARRWYR